MKTTLKQFLSEATVKDNESRKITLFVDTNDEDIAKIRQLLKTNCSVAYKSFMKGKSAIYRGMSKGPDVLQLQYNKGTRKAENTYDYYRMMIDSHPGFAGTDLPKRGKSMIASTDFYYARGYGSETYTIFPFDSTPIGVVPSNDIFDITFNLFDRKRINVDGVSMLFGRIFNFYSDRNKKVKTGVITPAQFIKNIDIIGMEAIVTMLQKTPEYDPYIKKADMGAEEFAKKYNITDGKSFLDYLYSNILTPEKLKFAALLPEQFYKKKFAQNEVWIGGKCIAVSYATSHRLKVEQE